MGVGGEGERRRSTPSNQMSCFSKVSYHVKSRYRPLELSDIDQNNRTEQQETVHSLTSIESDHHQFPPHNIRGLSSENNNYFSCLEEASDIFHRLQRLFQNRKNYMRPKQYGCTWALASGSATSLMHESMSESFLALKTFTQKRHINSLHKIRTFVLLSSLVLENFTDFILDFSLLSTLKHRQSNIKGPATEQEKKLKS